MRTCRLTQIAIGLVAALAAAGCGDDDDAGSTSAPTESGSPVSSAVSPAGSTSDTTSAAPGSVGEPTGALIEIGQYVSQTGFAAASTAQATSAALAWETWVNANGGVSGHPVKVHTADTAADGAKGFAAVRDLVENKNVLALVGSGDPVTDAASAQYLGEQNVAVISSTNQTPDFWSNPVFFPVGGLPTEEFQDGVMAIAKEAGVTTLAMAGCAEVAGCKAGDPSLTEAAPKYGIEYGGYISISATAPNYTAECIALKEKGAEMVELALAAATSQKLIADCSDQDFTPIYVFAQNSFGKELLDVPGLQAIGALTNLPYYLDDPALADFRSAMEANGTTDDISVAALYAWEALEMFRQAMASAPESPTREDVFAAMYTIQDNDLGGLIPEPISFVEGQGQPRISCLYAAGVDDGEYSSPVGTEPICRA